MEEFYRQAGLGRIVIDPQLVAAVFGSVQPRRPGLVAKTAARLIPRQGPGVRIKDIDGQMIRLAKCCSPVKGEPVVGYITTGRGLTVHSLRCPRVRKEILDGQRLVEVSWDPAFAGTFKARLLIKSEDAPGVLAKVAAAVADLEGNISKAEASMAEEGKARIRLDVRIRDIRHLEGISRRISGLKEVLSIDRI